MLLRSYYIVKAIITTVVIDFMYRLSTKTIDKGSTYESKLRVQILLDNGK